MGTGGFGVGLSGGSQVGIGGATRAVSTSACLTRAPAMSASATRAPATSASATPAPATPASGSGSYNTGTLNAGLVNTGIANPGNHNTGYSNIPAPSTRHLAGHYNTGSYNTGSYNTERVAAGGNLRQRVHRPAAWATALLWRADRRGLLAADCTITIERPAAFLNIIPVPTSPSPATSCPPSHCVSPESTPAEASIGILNRLGPGRSPCMARRVGRWTHPSR